MRPKAGPAVRRPKPSARPETQLVGRFGSFVLISADRPERPYVKIAEQLVDALKLDPRVTRCGRVQPFEEQWCSIERIYPAPADDEYVLFTGQDAVSALNFGDAIAFSVNVPQKNQRLSLKGEEIPTSYEVLWDGIFVLVTWRVPRGQQITMSGGHVAIDILRGASEKVGMDLYVQGCNMACDHGFAHTDVRFDARAEGSEVTYEPTKWKGEVNVRLQVASEERMRVRVFNDLAPTGRNFTLLKNRGRRILELDDTGRSKLSELTVVGFNRAEVQAEPLRQSLRDRWGLRGWRKESQQLIAAIWLILANIEMLRFAWKSELFEFENAAKLRGRGLLFERDHAGEVDQVNGLDPELMRVGVQDAAGRLDNRTMASVTVFGAVAGGIAGGLLGFIAGLVS